MLRKILILSIIMVASALATFAYSEDELTIIERNHYGQDYSGDTLADRLGRLETDLFGMAQSGDVDSRLDMISRMSGNTKRSAIITPDYNYYSVSQPKKGAIRNFFDNVTSPFSQGVVTGYTPSMGYSNSYTSYGNGLMDFFNNNSRQYCPYHNTYHDNRYGLNKIFKRRHSDDLSSNHHRHHRKHRHHRNNYRVGNNGFNTYNPYGSPYSIPTNGYRTVSSGSRVQILKD